VRLSTVAFRSLRRRTSRAAFLVAGLLVGIGTVVALLTLSAALTEQAQNNLETYGANILVAPRSEGLSLSYGGVSVADVAVGSREIREAGLSRLDSIPNRANIAIIAPELLGTVSVEGRRALLMGVQPKEEFALKKWWSLDGRPPKGDRELVAGATAAEVLGLRTGDRVTVGGRELTVTGVLRPTGSQDDDLLIAELSTAQSLLGRPGKVSLVQIAALCSNCPVEEIVRQVGGVLPGTRVTALQDKVKNNMHAIDRFRAFSWIVAGVIVVIEALVVFVTMMGAVNARTREIGVLRALGFRRRHVTGLILMEASAASLLAGVLGYLAGMGVSHLLLPLLGAQGVAVEWAPALAGGAVGLAVAIGALASLPPALHASRMDPTVALRAL